MCVCVYVCSTVVCVNCVCVRCSDIFLLWAALCQWRPGHIL